jgi:anaerobic magnesium-protoporphyrin IX monomethyl ester cyclase
MRVLFFTKPYVIDPLGIGYLAAVLRNAGHDVRLEHNDDCVKKAVSINPDIIAFSVTTGQHVEYERNARRLKWRLPGVPIVFGGPHPTYFPQVPDKVDFIVRGEAEVSMPWLLGNLPWAPFVVDPMPLVQDLDTLPMPDRSLMYKFPANAANPIKNVMSSRGCPFNCPYCYNVVYRGLYRGQKVVRYHSPQRVIAECLDLKAHHGAKFIFFADDEFTLHEDRLQEITSRYARDVALPYHVQLRIDLLTEAKARMLAASGCHSATFAIESGDEDYRRFVLRRHITNAQIVDGARMLHDHGIMVRTENMIGLPGESIDQAIATLDLNIQCRPELAWASLYQPYPGTVLGDRCIADGLFSGSVDALKPSFFEDSVLSLAHKSMFVNLQRVFGVVASFPYLRRGLRALLHMPANRVYDWAYKAWKNNRYDRKLYAY